MRRSPAPPLLLVATLLASCGHAAPPGVASPAPSDAVPGANRLLDPREVHLRDLEQLTFGGENAEAYWSFDGQQLIFQARPPGQDCDRIYRMPLATPLATPLGDRRAPPIPVSNGQGATTCAYFFPDGARVLFASTQLAGPQCPPRPDHSRGYVWAIHEGYDILKTRLDGGDPVRLTETPGYDAEATVCARDGSIVFTSVRDGDLDLYRMDADGKNVRRLTNTPGYDGGAFFSPDCSKIIWRASRPKPGQELDDYRALLAKGLVRPTKLEIYVANADGSDPAQITYLDAASFGPAWFPSGRRVIFSSNHGDPRGREFDLFAVDIDGTHLERITFTGGFDGFPMFSPDGTRLVFASNRATPPGRHDTNVFVARWSDATGADPAQASTASPADRILADVAWLADDAREGRGPGSGGLEASGAYIEDRFRALGLAPAGDGGSYRQPFPLLTGLSRKDSTALTLDGRPLAEARFSPLSFSAEGTVEAPLAFAGYGIVAPDLHRDDFAHADVRGKIAVVRRFVPDDEAFSRPEVARRLGDLRQKAFFAREHGARGLIVIDAPERPRGAPGTWKAPGEATFPALHPEGAADAGIAAVVVGRAEGASLIARLERHARIRARVTVALERQTSPAFNVIARLARRDPVGQRSADQGSPAELIVIGAHYDHLGFGGPGSLAPEKHEVHNGADDNASGTATLLEVAHRLATERPALKRDIVFAAFSGEEAGTLGSTHFVRTPPPGISVGAGGNVVAMLNLDMVGRMRANRVMVLGADTAREWPALVTTACERARIDCNAGGGGVGPSDQTAFYTAGVPVLHFFTGNHREYHKPTDDTALINAAGAAAIVGLVADLAAGIASAAQPPAYRAGAAPAPAGDARSFNAALGTIPDYAGPPAGQRGVLLDGVRSGSAAEKGGLRRGDILVRLAGHDIGGVEDLMFVLNLARPGETATAVVLRGGEKAELEVTFEEGRRR